MRCTKCGTDNAADSRFCNQCATPLSRACPKCAHLNAPDAKFCAQCAAALSPATAKLEPSRPSITLRESDDAAEVDGERKTVTALFADIKGSTELEQDLDPEEARAIVDPALKLMIDVVRRYDGYIVQSTGDGIFALFGAPVAHEDHPQRALHAALRMQAELRRYSAKLVADGGGPLQCRVGINTGEAVVRSIATGGGHTETTPIGHTINLASRMQAVAPVGSVAVAESTRKLCEGYFELKTLAPTRVKGISEPINVYEVVGAGPLRGHFELAARRGLTKFVGRAREVAEMKRALELARSGHGQIVAAVAEAGTGKSRLIYEFKATLPGDWKLLEAYSVSYGKASAYLPVLELLYRYFGIEDADDKAARLARIETRISALGPALNDTLPLLYTLLGLHEGPDPIAQMDPQIKRWRILDAIKRLILRESLIQPTVVIFEDLHWIDSETQALLDLLADGIANARVLLLVNFRPEYHHEWGNKSYYSQLRLDALGRESAAEMLSTLLGDGGELDPLKRMVIERTEGNPFFIEEMVQALFDQGALVRNGAVKVARSLSQLRLPPTVQGILASRIDRLGVDQKDLLQTLAVMGRESPLSLIRRVAHTTEAQLERMLGDLQAGEFIYEQPAPAGVEYTFKHALTQEVAYKSLLIDRRKQLHERAGQALESIFAGQMDDYLELLARHYSLTDNTKKAVEYLGRAAQQKLKRCAYADAVNDLTAAMDSLRKLPETADRIQRELLLQMTLGQAFAGLKTWAAQEAELAFTRALDICERLADPPERFFVLYGLVGVYHMRGQYRPARERAYQLLQQAESTNNPTQLLLAHYLIGMISFHTGELLTAKEHDDIALSLYDQERDSPLALSTANDPREGILSYAAWTLWYLGFPDQAVARINEAIAAARALSHPFSLASAEFFSTIVRALRREPHIVRETAERVIAFSAEHGFGFWLLFAPSLRGWAMAEQGQHEEGIELMRQALFIAHEAGVDIGRSNTLCMLAEGYRNAGRLDEALDAVKQALDTADAQEELCYEPEIYRLKGELLLRKADANAVEAQGCFTRAIEIARNQSAKSLELRATMSLARLLASQGRRDKARAMLAEIYGWFTEGFDTADLKDAKALLDELGASHVRKELCTRTLTD